MAETCKRQKTAAGTEGVKDKKADTQRQANQQEDAQETPARNNADQAAAEAPETSEEVLCVPCDPVAGYYTTRCCPMEVSPDPRCKLEVALRALAAKLRTTPTVPGAPEHPTKALAEAVSEHAAPQLPAKHCAFQGCLWHGGADEDLIQHVQTNHAADIEAVAGLLPNVEGDRIENSKMKVASAYNEAIAMVCRQGAPLASMAIDRRCLHQYATALQDDAVETLICFCCARKHPFLSSRKYNDIQWRQPLQIKERQGSPTGTFFWHGARLCHAHLRFRRIFGEIRSLR